MIWGNDWTDDDRRKGQIPGVALLRTCKQIHAEAQGEDYLHKYNTFLASFHFTNYNPVYIAKPFEMMRGVIEQTPEDLDWVPPRVLCVPAHRIDTWAPMANIRFLELRLLGPRDRCGSEVMTTPAIQAAGIHVFENSRYCVDACPRLERLAIRPSDWAHANARRQLAFFVGRFTNSRYEEAPQMHGHIQWIQQSVRNGGDSDELYLSWDCQMVVEGWLADVYGTATFDVV